MKIINADGSETLVDRDYAKQELTRVSTPMLEMMRQMYRGFALEQAEDSPLELIEVITEILVARGVDVGHETYRF